jgi:hypothetical protein
MEFSFSLVFPDIGVKLLYSFSVATCSPHKIRAVMYDKHRTLRSLCIKKKLILFPHKGNFAIKNLARPLFYVFPASV